MTWVVDRDQEMMALLVEFEFAIFQSQGWTFSNTLIEHLENKAQKEIVINLSSPTNFR